MTAKRFHYVLWALLGLVILASVLAAAGGNYWLGRSSGRLQALKLENRILEEQQSSLTQAKKDIDKYAELERTARQIVPQEKDQARTVRELISIAAASGVKIATIAFPTSNLGQAVPKAPAGEPGAGAPKPAPAPAISQVKPVENIKDLYQLDISVQSEPTAPVSYPRLLDFLNRLEHNRRTAQITSITIQTLPKNRDQLTFNLQLSVFIKP